MYSLNYPDPYSELQHKCIHLVVLKHLLTVVDCDLQITAAESSGDLVLHMYIYMHSTISCHHFRVDRRSGERISF